ncbi:unnamed protein product [Linum tenue]|uniref:Uncharacterized protein n=1 Tax=Linum tenue TaxID=586396 RepID=A0AAV0NHA9_9ROSI|nr:unnamed protein product [Linum tenue]
MRRLSERVRRRREAAEDPQLRPRVPHRLHRRLATEQRQLPALPDQHYLLHGGRSWAAAFPGRPGFWVIFSAGSEPNSVPGKDRHRRGRGLRGD